MKFFECIVLSMICMNGYCKGCSIICPECTQLCIKNGTRLGGRCEGFVDCWMECPSGTYGIYGIRPSSTILDIFLDY